MDEEILTAETDDETTAPAETDDDKSEKSVSSDLIRGHINTIILRSLYDGDKYGYEIIAEIERKSAGQYSLKQPSLYSALKRLEKDGYITSYWGGSVGGGRRKYFSLTDEGKTVSEQNQAEWEYSRTIIDSLISDRDFDFNNPAPTAVDMSVLRKTTSRVPSSRDGEDESEEFVFEPGFDDGALREKLEEEVKEKQAELNAAYNEKIASLEHEYADKFAALDRERADFEAEKLRLEEEMNSREQELNDSYMANLRQLAILREQQEAALQTKREEMERELSEEQAKLNAKSDEQAEARAAAEEELKNELEAEKQKNVAASEEHERTFAALKEANEQTISELNERYSAEIQSLRAAADADKENAVRLAREEGERRYEDQLQAERTRHSEILNEERQRLNAALAEESARHEAQIRDDRMRYQQALDDQIATLRRQMQLEMEKREQEIIHRNFISLVNAPASQPNYQEQPAPAPEEVPKAPTEDYRNVVGRLYENTVRPAAKSAETQSATPVSGIDFRDIQKRASRDGLRVDTVGGETVSPVSASSDGVNTVHKGKALFLSSIVVFFWCMLVGGITMGIRSNLTIPVAFPYLMWGFGVVLLLTTGLLYANHFGENRLRKPSLAFINSIVVYALIVIVSLIVALSVRIDFSDTSELMTFVLLPAIYFVAVLIFGICYFLQVKPKKRS